MRTALTATWPGARSDRRPSRWTRIRARLSTGRLDRELDSGLPVTAGTARAVHAERIASATERRRLACGLQALLDRANLIAPVVSLRIPLQRKSIVAEARLIGDIVALLTGAGPVRARGVARLRLLISDGAGPLYRPGNGSVAAQLRGVIAAL